MLAALKARHGIVFLLALTLASQAIAQTKACPATEADKPAVARTIRKIFEAAQNNDTATFDALRTPDFFMYDGGVRFDGDAIVKRIVEKHKQGYKYLWSVSDTVVDDRLQHRMDRLRQRGFGRDTRRSHTGTHLGRVRRPR